MSREAARGESDLTVEAPGPTVRRLQNNGSADRCGQALCRGGDTMSWRSVGGPWRAMAWAWCAPWRAALAAAVVSCLLLSGDVQATAPAEDGALALADLAQLTRPPGGRRGFAICQDQTYALCATARCFVFNEVAYCRCDVERGDSISLPFNYGNGRNVCTANAAGARNGYMISTFSVPDSVLAPNGDQALYTCPAGTSDGAYAQCDGGFCFTSTEGQRFPGFDRPLKAGEIICSCPITVADPQTARLGFQIAGPYPCQRSFFRNCQSPPASNRTGATIYVGAPTGTAAFLARRLNGSVPPLNQCRP